MGVRRSACSGDGALGDRPVAVPAEDAAGLPPEASREAPLLAEAALGSGVGAAAAWPARDPAPIGRAWGAGANGLGCPYGLDAAAPGAAGMARPGTPYRLCACEYVSPPKTALPISPNPKPTRSQPLTATILRDRNIPFAPPVVPNVPPYGGGMGSDTKSFSVSVRPGRSHHPIVRVLHSVRILPAVR